ncbi:hypothetical protein NKI01_22085 [Mesorhizobium sp. M0815]|uniref:hypothetical protein n=1 Tax=Mesorhizobium sp. M0815 TaxID=2957005 RepID=UPI0033357252
MRYGEIHGNKAGVQAPPEALDATAAATNLMPRAPAPAFTLSRTGFDRLLYAVGDNEADRQGGEASEGRQRHVEPEIKKNGAIAA